MAGDKMILNTAYIMSCLPDVSEQLRLSEPIKYEKNIKNKEVRVNGILIQLEWLYLNNIDNIKYQSMRWFDSDKEIVLQQFSKKFKSIEFIDTAPIHFSTSRNRLLMDFYNSDQDWGLFLDDDGLIDPRTPDNFSDGPKTERLNWSDSGNFIKWLKEQPDRSKFFYNSVNEIGLICPLNPGSPGAGAWGTSWTEENSEYLENWRMVRSTSAKGTVLFVRNFWKHNRDLIWFRPAYEMPAGEDFAFAYDVFLNGHLVYVCRNFLLKELSSGAQGTWQKGKSKEQISKERNAYKGYLETIFGNFGVEQKEVGGKIQLHSKKFFNMLTSPPMHISRWFRKSLVKSSFDIIK